jgi:NAD(P)-dependent dehydrogenase (short-subunit alcohol dehydrogenase family)
MKTFIVGGSRGIGRAAVLELAGRGERCAFAYVNDDVAAADLVAEASSAGPKPIAVRGDIAVDAQAMIDAATRDLGGLDSVVVTAVPALVGPIMQIEYERFRRAMDVVVWGFVETARAAAAVFGPEGGSVVGVSSLGSWRAAGYYGSLGPAKAALESAVRYLAVELAPRNVRINAISPCLVAEDTHFQGDAEQIKRFLAPVAKRTPMGRLASAPELAKIALAIGSPAFGFMTGQTLVVDGGYSLTA